MIAPPGYRIRASIGERDEVVAEEPWRSRVQRFIETYRGSLPPERHSPLCTIELHNTIPAHIGLGSGTQLGMAVAQALALLAGEGGTSPEQLALRVLRGKRSAIGIHGFHAGGFLVEAGKKAQATVGTLVSRLEFPEAWRFILIRPRAVEGLSGDAEIHAFAELGAMPTETTGTLARLLLTELQPAIIEADFSACSEALYEFGRTVGEYFAPAQQGIYADVRMAALVEHLRQRGISGVGQTSWGPTLFVLMHDESAAKALINDLATSTWGDCEFSIAAPLNTGAVIEFPETFTPGT